MLLLFVQLDVLQNWLTTPCDLIFENVQKDIFNSGAIKPTHKPQEAFHTVKRN